MKPGFLICSIRLAAAACLGAPAAGEVNFDREVLPILEDHCIDCHGDEKQKSALRLDTVLGLLRGGESGEPLLVGGKSAESYLFKRVTTEVGKDAMPPKGKRLAPEQVAILRRWIDEGAAIPGAEAARKELKITTDHWSFQPVKRPAVPQGGDAAARGEIDEFVRAKLRENRLEPSPEADRTTLIRRLYAVMHGMPPTPEEVAAFSKDPRPDAYERLVDEVLASPRFGERWARHWMDVARYAESNGFETNHERKTAYHYRDWLVESFNADKPYDRFIKEQLAGDRLVADAATGFLVAGPFDIVQSPDINLTLMQRQDVLADMVNTTGTAFLGLTMGCARCHNHKFDPILQKDYYSMQAVFEGVSHGERPLLEKIPEGAEGELTAARAAVASLSSSLENFRKQAAAIEPAGSLRLAVNARLNEEHFAPVEALSLRFTVTASTDAEPCLDELEIYGVDGHNLAIGGVPTASGVLPGYAIHQLEHINDGRTGNGRSWISDTPGEGWVRIGFPSRVTIQRVVWSRARDGEFCDRIATGYRIEAETEPGVWTTVASSEDRQAFGAKEDPDAFLSKLPAADAEAARKVRAALAAAKQKIEAWSTAPVGWAGTFSQPGKTHRLYRGEPLQKREVVAPDVLSVVGTLGLTPDAPEQERRLKFAGWVAGPDNPLTARVMVNRLWHYTFGSGIVETPSDFGLNGARPTHPELLDWLADEFVRSGWSVKHMQRLMLRSATFRQSSAPRADALAADSGGRFLWRYTPRRLEAEAIRDSMLAVSGTLDLTMGGPGFSLMDVVEENVRHYYPKEKFAPAEFRRMVYQRRIRQTTDSVFGSFDCPDGGSVTPKRSRSNTPLQALNLFNSGFTIQQAELLAQRLVRECGAEPAEQVDRAFLLFFGRLPDVAEREASAAMIQSHGLNSFTRAMFNTSEFLFVF
ncbi:PSD1 and planctomycete cytochrome C domain-containing protein [Luteolibacter sp. Populi]|uniref:PSD1 and planctomycete cytochrome C domain-containing protein n=1 Tax=Luteolibacter sp. Populi TaxID=3230487 RepID=UPI003467CAA5